MTRKDGLVILACGVVLAAIAVLLVRIAERGHGLALELDRVKASEPSDALRARLATLTAEVELVWFASAREALPAEHRGLESTIADLFRALERESAGRVTGRIVDPTGDPALVRHLAAVGLAPYRARRIERDGWRETSVWSCLRIAYGPHGSAAIPAFGPEHVAGLQAWIVAELDELEHPRRARIAVAAPDDYASLRRALRAAGEIADSDFETSARLEDDVDLFFWIDPVHASGAHLAELERFLARGGSVVVAGSRWNATFERAGAEPGLRFEPTGFPAETLLAEFGLRANDDLLLDARGIESGSGTSDAGTPHLVRAIGQAQDFRALARQPNGSLLFAAPTAFSLDAQRLEEQELVAHVLASSPESSFLHASPTIAGGAPATIALAGLAPREGTQAVGAQALLALLAPSDPWRGRIVFAAASTPFRDEYFEHPAFAHAALVRILVDSLASRERRAFRSAASSRPAALPALGARERTLLRALVVFAVPLALVLAAFARLRGGAPRTRSFALPWKLVLAAAAVLVVVRLGRGGAALDLARAETAGLAPETRALFARHASELAPVTIDLRFSRDSELPPEFRPLVRRARELVERCANATPGVVIGARFADSDDGAAQIRVTSQDEESTTVRRIESRIVISARDAREELVFPDVASFEHLEFRLAFALDRLARGRPVRVAIAADVPRPSPAEALIDYQKQGLFAPSEGDVYGQARALLAGNGFEVEFVEPSAPMLSPGIDLLVALQPRREARPLVAALARHLASGGRALVAAQHFVVRSRQRQARDLELALWPEPQFDDLDRFYFPALGLGLPRDLLLDELAGSAEIDARVELAAGSFVHEQESATNPLLVRAVASNFVREAPIVRGLSDLLFPFATRITLDRTRLAELGLRARPLVLTSDRAWSHTWSGGDLPASVLEPATSADGTPIGRIGKQALAVLVEGRFPPPEIDPGLVTEDGPTPAPDATREGRLVLIGGSELFQNGRLHLAGYDHAAFLLASVAELTLEPELQAILARRTSEPGFDFVAPRTRIVWRTIAIGGAPLVLLAAGLLFQRIRARAPVAIDASTRGRHVG